MCRGGVGDNTIDGCQDFGLLESDSVHHYESSGNVQSVIRQVDKWAKKDRAQSGLTFLNRNGLEYNFGDDDDQATLVGRPELAPFPDMPAEAPGILTEHEEIC